MENRRGGQGQPRAPSPSSLNLTRRGQRPPFLLSFSPFLLLSYSNREGEVLLPVGVGLLMGRAKGGRPPPPPPLLYIRGGAHPLETQQLIIDLLAVCGAPSTIVHLDNIVAVLRRSPASVEHHHRHHTVVLTKLSLNTRLDRSSRDVIELNVC